MSEPMNDFDLICQFTRDGSQPAFRQIVERYTNLVYTCAVQRLQDAHAAQDVTQAVFLTLALKAKELRPDTSLPGWLFTTTRHVAARYQRGEQRRKEREMRASEQHQIDQLPDSSGPWQELKPHLAVALDSLPVADREAVLLRFYRQVSYQDVAAELSTTEDSARKRVDRALVKLRQFFARKGVTLSGTTLAALLTAHALEAAPVGLSAQATATALAGVGGTLATTTPTFMLAKGAMFVMSISKLKVAGVIAAACIVVTGTGIVAVKQLANQPSTVPRSGTPVNPASADQFHQGTITAAHSPVPASPVNPPVAAGMGTRETPVKPIAGASGTSTFGSSSTPVTNPNTSGQRITATEVNSWIGFAKSGDFFPSALVTISEEIPAPKPGEWSLRKGTVDGLPLELAGDRTTESRRVVVREFPKENLDLLLPAIRQTMGDEIIQQGTSRSWKVVTGGSQVTEQMLLEVSLGEDTRRPGTLYLTVFHGPNYVKGTK